MEPEKTLTAEQIAEILQVSVKTVRRLTRAGHLPHYRLGRCVRYRASELEGWLRRHRRAPIHVGDLL